MKGIILIGIYSLFFVVARSQDQMVVDPNASARNLPGSFSRIKVSNAIKVIITQSETESIAVSAAEEKYKEGIRTEIDNGTLKIYYEGSKWTGKDRKLKAYVSFKNLSQLDVSGASDVAGIGKLTLKGLTINVSGASTVKADFSVDHLDIKLSGASKASISGESGMLNVECHGATDLDAYDLKSISCNAEASGASDIDIFVEKELNASASGASSIHYKGSPAIANVKKSGASSISKKD